MIVRHSPLAHPRSPGWPACERAFLRAHPTCAVCGTKKGLNVHHVKPFHLHPKLELDPRNLITLCRPHHLLVGHLMDWKSFNAACRADACRWAAKVAGRPGRKVRRQAAQVGRRKSRVNGSRRGDRRTALLRR